MTTVQLLHATCKVPIVLERREIFTQPNDPSWPKNQDLILPYCPKCTCRRFSAPSTADSPMTESW